MNSDTVEEIRETWTPPKYASLHWDSKLLPKLTDKYTTEERLTVAVGTQDEIKLLGVPCYEPGTDQHTGDIITQKTAELLAQWNCADSIVNMTFDTTASNTGHVTAACVALQHNLGKALLCIRGYEDRSVKIARSITVCPVQETLSNDSPIRQLDMTGFSAEGELLAEELRAVTLLQVSQDHDFRRDNYKELIELCVLFLNGNVWKEITFKKPGAMHKARWMAKRLYAIKICLFEEQISSLPQETITTKQQVPKVRAFVNFVTLVYIPWWLKSTSPTDAPCNDLDLNVRLIEY